MTRYFLLLLSAIFLVHAEGWAQTQTEDEDTTVRRCLEDLASESAEVRRRGALVVGKYDVPEARAALLRCLEDNDAQVRRSALVSLGENRFLPTEVKLPVMRRLSDADVEVRRLASSMLRECLGGNRAQQRILPIPQANRPPVRMTHAKDAAPSTEAETKQEEEIKSLLTRGLEDSDASVRQNVLRALRYYPHPVDRRLLEGALRDDSAELCLLALQEYSRCEGEEDERVGVIAPLARRPEATVRSSLLRFLDTINSPAAVPVLWQLAEDSDDKIVLSALRQLARRQDNEAREKLTAMLRDTKRTPEERRQILHCLTSYGVEYVLSVCRELLADKETPAVLQAAALQLFSAIEFQDKVEVAEILPFLNSPDARLRRAALSCLQVRRQKLTREHLRDFEKTAYHEVREAMLKWSKAEPVWQLELARQYCVDDNAAVRKEALTILLRLHDDGWEEMAAAALEDESQEIQILAITQLLGMPKVSVETIEAVEEYRQRCHDHRRLPMIDRALQRWKARTRP